MTDSEIIKALECFAIDKDFDETHCIGCAFEHQFCTANMSEDIAIPALSLINRQKAELDDLKRDDLPRCKDALRRANEIGMGLEKENQELRAEIERLKSEIPAYKYAVCVKVRNGLVYTKTLDDYDWLIGDISAEAIKEFAERLKEIAHEREHDGMVHWTEIDNLVKEMVGEDSNTPIVDKQN